MLMVGEGTGEWIFELSLTFDKSAAFPVSDMSSDTENLTFFFALFFCKERKKNSQYGNGSDTIYSKN